VAGGFLDKLLGRSAPPPAEVQAVVHELDRLGGQRPALAGPIAVLRDLLPYLYEVPITDTQLSLDRDRADAKLACGVPLLRGETVPLDLASFQQRWRGACAVLRRHGSTAAEALAQALDAGRFDAGAMVGAVLAGRPASVHARADELGLDAGLTATVLRLTLFPWLSRVSAQLTALRDGTPWQQGYCPTCGSWPLLGEYRGLDQTRYLRCGLCAAGWEVPRLLCPFCGTRDHEKLGYFYPEEEPTRFRVTTCEECRGYVKTATTLQPLNPPQLLLTDVITLDLDLAAAARGYVVPVE
jgi:FdhE protein